MIIRNLKDKKYLTLISSMLIYSNILLANTSKIEFHINLCKENTSKIVSKLTNSKSKIQNRQIYYFDTDNLDLYRKGVIIRGRIKNQKRSDTAIKLRPFDQSQLTSRWANNKSVNCENDYYPPMVKSSCRFKSKISSKIMKRTLRTNNFNNIISDNMIDFIQDHKNFVLDLSTIRPYGPVLVQKFEKLNFRNDLVLEIWPIGDKTIVELSFKSSEDELPSLKKDLFKILKMNNLNYCTPTLSKTKESLKHFKNKK